MADAYSYRETLRYVACRCALLFRLDEFEPGFPSDAGAVAAALATNDLAPGQADPQVLALCRAFDSFGLQWSVPKKQRRKLKLKGGDGSIAFLALESMYRSWDDEFGVDFYLSDSVNDRYREHYQNLGRHLHRFRVVDYFADFASTLVGIYLSEPHNPELYVYQDGEGNLPVPLGVDVQGYAELLKLSLGYVYWQLLLVELNEYCNGPQTEVFAVRGLNAQWFVQDMTRLNPGFTLEKFVARYAEVRLRR